MAHSVSQGPHPLIMVMELTGDLTHEDMVADDAIGLNNGRRLYLMLDVSKMNVGLPDGFLDGAKNSFFINPNLIHMAMYVESDLLRTIANMVAKVTRNVGKLSLHNSREAAMNHLLALIEGQ
jgi:hypothetical protein